MKHLRVTVPKQFTCPGYISRGGPFIKYQPRIACAHNTFKKLSYIQVFFYINSSNTRPISMINLQVTVCIHLYTVIDISMQIRF